MNPISPAAAIFAAAFLFASAAAAQTEASAPPASGRTEVSAPPAFPVSALPLPGGGPGAGITAASFPASPVTGGGRSGIAAGAMQEEVTSGDGKKSVGLAVIYSLLLPGMGELYAGDYGSGKYFTGADGVLWIGLGAMDYHARSVRDDARAYAALHAGFDPEGKDDTYFVNVGNFDDVYQYNEQVLRERDAFKLYDPLSSYYWKWDTGTNRSVYRDQRVAADGLFNNTRFVVAALVANRILSAINAARIVISGNRDASGESLDIGAGLLGDPLHPHGISLTLTRQF